jgi:hypothetical protein
MVLKLKLCTSRTTVHYPCKEGVMPRKKQPGMLKLKTPKAKRGGDTFTPVVPKPAKAKNPMNAFLARGEANAPSAKGLMAEAAKAMRPPKSPRKRKT